METKTACAADTAWSESERATAVSPLASRCCYGKAAPMAVQPEDRTGLGSLVQYCKAGNSMTEHLLCSQSASHENVAAID